MILVEGAGPTYVEWALGHADRSADDFHVVTFTMLAVADDTPTEVINHPRVVSAYLGTDDAVIARSGGN